MRFWQSLSFTETEQVVPLARHAEELGFEGVLVSDHLFHPETLTSKYPYSDDGAPPFDAATEWPEAWSLIGAIGSVTERLRLTTGIYILPLRHPLVVAKASATLSILTRGRFALGVGVGWVREEYDQLGEDFHTRGRRCDEMIEIIRKVQADGPVAHHGRFYDFEPLHMSPLPSEPAPIYVGGVSSAALRRAGRLGDGWIGSGHPVDQVASVLAEIDRHRREAGRAEMPFESIVPVTDLPDAGTCQRLEEAGATSMLCYPLSFALGPGSSLDGKRSALERFANDVIAKLA